MKTTYNLSAFDLNKARDGHLCVVTKDQSNDPVSSDNDTRFFGTGICAKNYEGRIFIYINSIPYQFNNSGVGINAAATSPDQLYVKLGTVADTITDVGGSIASNVKNTIAKSRGSGGEIEYDPPQSDPGSYNIFVDNLNARDQFAAQALRGLLSHIEDPAILSDSEMNYYCNTAYKWAANMMVAAAKVRASIDDQTEGAEEEVEVGALETNTEKLLNNLIVELSKTNETVIPSGQTDPVYSERISIPTLITFLNNYVKDGSNTLGLKDLITALNNINTSIQAFTTAMGNRFTALDNSVGSMQTDVTYIKNNIPSTSNLATKTDVTNAKNDVISAMPSTSGLATNNDVSSAENAIIAAMPSCRYTPPSE